MNDARWVRPAFLSLVGLFGLVLMITGLVRGAMAGFHIAEPRYGVADSRVDRLADAIALQSQLLVQTLALAGDAPPGFEQLIKDEQKAIRDRAVAAAKDEAYDNAVAGALQFVLGGFVFLIGAGAAKRAARRDAGAPASAAGPSPFPPGPVGGRGPTVASESPVGRLQEAPPRPAPRPDPRTVTSSPAKAAEPRPTPVLPQTPEKAEEPKKAPRKAAPPKQRPAAPATAADPTPAPRPATPPAPRPATTPPPPRPAVTPQPAPAPASEPSPEPMRPATPPLASPPRPRPAAPTPASPPPPPFRPAPPSESGGEERNEP